jgi:thioredoxin reductase (NADPH)
MEKVLILGSGCAGYTAAIYTARANLNPLLLTGLEVNGQLGLTTEVENYPGFPAGVMGPKLMEMMKQQAERFGTRILYERAQSVDLNTRPFTVKTDDHEFQSETLIISTGASPRKLGVPGEFEYSGAAGGAGVTYCATCDGAFYKNVEVIVVGGGDTAMEEALFLTRYASKVSVVHRRDALRASKIMQERAFKNPKIEFIWDTAVKEIIGNEQRTVTGVHLTNLVTKQTVHRPISGVFVAIGHVPNTQLFEGQLDLNENGYIVTDQRQRTNVAGVYAAGDAQDHIYRQAVTAAGTGCAAAIEAERYIAALECK